MPDPKPELDRFHPLRIWRSLDHERKLRAATAFWRSTSVQPGEIEVAAALLAQSLRFRPQSIRTAPLAKRASYLANFAAMPDHLAANLLYAYHLTHQAAMMARFLDNLGIAHEAGRIKDEVKRQEPAKLAEAAASLFKEFDARDVTIYLETLVSQDAETWGGLAETLKAGEKH